MTTFVETEPKNEIGIEGIISGLSSKIRRKIQEIDLERMSAETGLSRLEIIEAHRCEERVRGSRDAKHTQKGYKMIFQNWYKNFLPVDKETGRNIRTNRHLINARIKSRPAEYSESTAAFIKRMIEFAAIFSKKSDPLNLAMKSEVIKQLSRAYVYAK